MSGPQLDTKPASDSEATVDQGNAVTDTATTTAGTEFSYDVTGDIATDASPAFSFAIGDQLAFADPPKTPGAVTPYTAAEQSQAIEIFNDACFKDKDVAATQRAYDEIVKFKRAGTDLRSLQHAFAELLIQEKKYPQAETLLESVIEAGAEGYKQFDGARADYLVCLLETKQYEEAVKLGTELGKSKSLAKGDQDAVVANLRLAQWQVAKAETMTLLGSKPPELTPEARTERLTALVEALDTVIDSDKSKDLSGTTYTDTALYYKAFALSALGKHAESLATYQELYERKPEEGLVLSTLINISAEAARSGNGAAAVAALEEAQERLKVGDGFGDNAARVFQFGLNAVIALKASEKADPAAAEKVATFLKELDPDSEKLSYVTAAVSILHLKAGQAARAKGDKAGAVGHLDQVGNYLDLNAYVAIERGYIALSEGKFSAAEGFFEDATGFTPEKVTNKAFPATVAAGYIGLARVAIAQKDLDEAKKQLEAAGEHATDKEKATIAEIAKESSIEL